MLQWTGGSRRKVNASRKSTHNRQKQYFEQRKRLQQAPGLDKCYEVRNNRAHCSAEPRSLDILSLLNVATVDHQGNSTHRNEVGATQVSSVIQKDSSAPALKEIISKCANNLQGTCCQPESLLSEKPAAASYLNNMQSAHKSGGKLYEPYIFDSPEISVLDLLNDDGPRSVSEGRLSPEAHVAFSVEGLGNMEIGAPTQSPSSTERRFEYPLKASKQSRLSPKFKSMASGLRFELHGLMDGIKVSDGIPLGKLCNPKSGTHKLHNMNGTEFEDSTQNHCYYETGLFYSNADYHIDRDDEEMPCFLAKSDAFHEGFHDERINELPLKDGEQISFSVLSENETSEWDFGFQLPNTPNVRRVATTKEDFEISAQFDPNLSYTPSLKEQRVPSFDSERLPTASMSSIIETMFDHHPWSFSANENAHEQMSSLSEESCSSAAVRNEGSYDLGMDSVKKRRNQNSLRDKQKNCSDSDYNVEGYCADRPFCTDLNGSVNMKNGMGTRKFDKAYSKKAFDQDDHFEEYPECGRLLEPTDTPFFNESSQSVEAAPLSRSNNRFSATMDKINNDWLPKENPFSLPKLSVNRDLNSKRMKSNIWDDDEIFEDVINESAVIGRSPGLNVQLSKHTTHSQCTLISPMHILLPGRSTGENVGKDDPDACNIATDKPGHMRSVVKDLMADMSSAANTDCKSNFPEHEIPKVESQELNDYKKRSRSFPEVPESGVVTEDMSQSSIHNKVQLVDSSVFASENGEGEITRDLPLNFLKKKDSSNHHASYQVMLGSSVLQLLCVQKVLMEASEMRMR